MTGFERLNHLLLPEIMIPETGATRCKVDTENEIVTRKVSCCYQKFVEYCKEGKYLLKA